VERLVVTIVRVGKVVVYGTVPEKAVTGGGVLVVVYMSSTVLFSIIIDVGAIIVVELGAPVMVTVTVSGQSGPSRLARARRACFCALSLGAGRFVTLVDTGGEDAGVAVLSLVSSEANSNRAEVATLLEIHLAVVVTVRVDVVAE
jgi:hypothetical protein